MKRLRTCLGTLLLLSATAVLTFAEERSADPLAAAIAKGTFSFDARLRWEYADQENLRAANAGTVRTLFGYTTAAVDGIQAMIQGENVAILNRADDYNASGTNPGGAGRTAIADPAGTDVNQAWVGSTFAGDTMKLGRQRIVLGNARFVGDVGWRQNMQTFDAATFTAAPAAEVSLFYGYVSRVSRVFFNQAPQPDFTSDSHLVNLAYSGVPYGTLTAYAYLLDFKNSAPNSSNTFGASFAGQHALTPAAKLTYRLEAATQRGARNNPLRYTATYYVGELGATAGIIDIGGGYEVLGSDGGRKGFATPLATLHAFNGWADEFLTTPNAGLTDSYAWLGVTAPGGFPLKAIYHQFRSDVGSHNYGDEWDGLVTHKLTKHWVVLAKAAHYNGKPPFFDTDKLWLQTEYTF